jgi:cysteine-rich secretory family protein
MKNSIFVLILMLGGAAARPQSPMEQQLLDLVNRERVKQKLSKLEWNGKLAQAALTHSRLLDQHQDLSHQFAGEPPVQQRVGATGLRFDQVAENVGEAQEVATVHDYLMHSPGHRANILNPNYNAIGIAIVQHGSQLFATEDFARMVAYNEKEFQDAVVSAFARMRRAKKLRAVDVVADPRLRKAACAKDMNTNRMVQTLPSTARLLTFSASDPSSLPDELHNAAADRSIDRMSIGVCQESGGRNGFTHFWVVAAFYRSHGDEQ